MNYEYLLRSGLLMDSVFTSVIAVILVLTAVALFFLWPRGNRRKNSCAMCGSTDMERFRTVESRTSGVPEHTVEIVRTGLRCKNCHREYTVTSEEKEV